VEEITEDAEIVARVAALDIGKATLVACVRVPHEGKPGRRLQEVRTFATTTPALLELHDWLMCQGVTLCVMEATSTYWKPPFYLLEDDIECWVVNARDVKNVPGRPKTDKLDAVWLAKLAERGMLRPSFVPPLWQRELRDLCRYRRTLIQERTREKQRTEKLLEDTQIKLSSVISDIFGVSGRAMLEALIAGQRDPWVLADLARGSMRGKKSVLQEALTGQFRDHHGWLLRMMLDRIDALSAQIDQLTARIDEAIAPFARQVAQLDEIPGRRPHRRPGAHRRDRRRYEQVPYRRAPGLVGQVRAAGPAVGGQGQTRDHRQGQPLDRRRPRRGRHRGRPNQDLPRLPLPPARPPPRQAARPGRRRQLHPHHRLAPAVRP
jgi:transposase